MRFHLRFPGDDWVDRPDLEAQQCVEATGTNTPINTNTKQPKRGCKHRTKHNIHIVLASTVQSLTQHTNHTPVSVGRTIAYTSRTRDPGMPPIGVSVVDSGGETPGPIPNPEAKPARADGTAPGREWESRLPPTQQLHTQAPAVDHHHDDQQRVLSHAYTPPAHRLPHCGQVDRFQSLVTTYEAETDALQPLRCGPPHCGLHIADNHTTTNNGDHP